MNDDELEGVIAHELSHVRNYDILTSSIAATIAGAITYMAQMGKWAMIFGGMRGGRDDDRGGGGISALLMIFLAPFAALLLQLFLSRTREYSADETGVRMVGSADGLISALQKLGAYNKRIPYFRDFSVNFFAVYRQAFLWPGHPFFAFQHSSSFGGSYRCASPTLASLNFHKEQ